MCQPYLVQHLCHHRPCGRATRAESLVVLRDGVCDKLPAGAAPEGCPYLEPYDEGRRLAFYDAHCSGHCFREGLRALSNTSALLSRDAHQLAAQQFQACREEGLHGLENVRQHQAYHIRRLEILAAVGGGAQGRGPVNGGGVAKNGYPHHQPQQDPRVHEELRRIAAENLTVRLRSEQMDVAREATARDVAELASKVAAMHEVIDEMLLSYQYLALVGHSETVAAAEPRGREEEEPREEVEEEVEEEEEVVEQHHDQHRKRSHDSSTPESEASFATEVRGDGRRDR